MFQDTVDLRKRPLLERKERLKAILPSNQLIAFSRHRKANGTKFFAEAERKGLEGVMAKRADSAYASGSRTADWLKIKTAKRQEVVIAGGPRTSCASENVGASRTSVRRKPAKRIDPLASSGVNSSAVALSRFRGHGFPVACRQS
ncbi:ATP-dependent DNA ligase [Bradyrhizobium sp. USDA 4504]